MEVDAQGWEQAKAALERVGARGRFHLVVGHIRDSLGLKDATLGRRVRAAAQRMSSEPEVRAAILQHLHDAREDVVAELVERAVREARAADLRYVHPSPLDPGSSLGARMRHRAKVRKVAVLAASIEEVGTAAQLTASVSLAVGALGAVGDEHRRSLEAWIDVASPIVAMIEELQQVGVTYDEPARAAWLEGLTAWRSIDHPRWQALFDEVIVAWSGGEQANASPKDVAHDPAIQGCLSLAWTLAGDLCSRWPVLGADEWLDVLQQRLVPDVRESRNRALALEASLWAAERARRADRGETAIFPVSAFTGLLPTLGLLFAAARKGEWSERGPPVRSWDRTVGLLEKIQDRPPEQKLHLLRPYLDSWPTTETLTEFLRFTGTLSELESFAGGSFHPRVGQDLRLVALTSKVLAFAPSDGNAGDPRWTWELAPLQRPPAAPATLNEHLGRRLRVRIDVELLGAKPAEVRRSGVGLALTRLPVEDLSGAVAAGGQLPGRVAGGGRRVLDDGDHNRLYGTVIRDALRRALGSNSSAPAAAPSCDSAEGMKAIIAMYSVPCVDRRGFLGAGEPTPWTLRTLLTSLAVVDAEFRDQIYDPIMACGRFGRVSPRINDRDAANLKYLRLE